MKKFIAIYQTPKEVAAQSAKMSPENYEKGMQKWYDWKDKCGENIVVIGAPVFPGKVINGDQKWTEGQSLTGGYSILQAENFETAKGLFQNHPHLSWGPGCTIEVHEFMPM